MEPRPTDPAANDPFNLDRFVAAQQHSYAEALSELRAGRKQTHWMWFIFPQIAGLGSSPAATLYAIERPDEAQAYLAHPFLGARLLECCRALLAVEGKSASDIMGCPDDLKLRSSMTLFSLADPERPEFRQVLDKYFEGEHDPRTIELLDAMR